MVACAISENVEELLLLILLRLSAVPADRTLNRDVDPLLKHIVQVRHGL
jgi:hypothetical protein